MKYEHTCGFILKLLFIVFDKREKNIFNDFVAKFNVLQDEILYFIDRHLPIAYRLLPSNR